MEETGWYWTLNPVFVLSGHQHPILGEVVRKISHLLPQFSFPSRKANFFCQQWYLPDLLLGESGTISLGKRVAVAALQIGGKSCQHPQSHLFAETLRLFGGVGGGGGVTRGRRMFSFHIYLRQLSTAIWWGWCMRCPLHGRTELRLMLWSLQEKLSFQRYGPCMWSQPGRSSSCTHVLFPSSQSYKTVKSSGPICISTLPRGRLEAKHLLSKRCLNEWMNGSTKGFLGSSKGIDSRDVSQDPELPGTRIQKWLSRWSAQ